MFIKSCSIRGVIRMDKISKQKRSENMSKIKSRDTSIEIKVRKYLFSLGFRYRKNVKSLPGKPDIVLPKYKTVIFINGCFWHRHPDCKYAATPSTHQDFWQKSLWQTCKMILNTINNLKTQDGMSLYCGSAKSNTTF